LAQQDWVATASDGRATIDFIGRFIQPRAYGTFPRKIRRFALEEAVVTLACALPGMTELLRVNGTIAGEAGRPIGARGARALRNPRRQPAP
jgi:hypothetical protein